MPMYEYECDKCSQAVELLRPVKERDEPVVCETPECHGRVIKRKLSPSVFKFRGSGAHATDYGKTGPKE